MPRPLTYRDNDEAAQAGAVTLNRMDALNADERRFQYQMERDRVGDLRYAEQDQRAQAREERITQAQDLDNEVQRWHYERERALDDNAKRQRLDLDQQSVEGNQALRDINLDDPEADTKLADWRVKYFRLLHPEYGDKRLQTQFEVNQKMLEQRRIEREKADTLRQAKELARSEGLKLDRITDGKPTYARPDAAKTTASKPNHVELYQDALAASAPVYGVSESGSIKDFQPTIAGRDKQTHVKVAFQDPSGKPHESVIDRNLFDSMVAASNARRQAASFAAPAASTPSTAAGADHNAALEWAKANPNDPRAAAIRARNGL